jgi:hypothetical protein
LTQSSTPDFHTDDPTAQDVIDALRFALIGQKDPKERLRLVDQLLEYAPETDNDRGVAFLLHMIADGGLKVALADA